MSETDQIGVWSGDLFAVRLSAEGSLLSLAVGWAPWRQSFFVNVARRRPTGGFLPFFSLGLDDDDPVIATVDELTEALDGEAVLSEAQRAALVEAQRTGAPTRC